MRVLDRCHAWQFDAPLVGRQRSLPSMSSLQTAPPSITHKLPSCDPLNLIRAAACQGSAFCPRGDETRVRRPELEFEQGIGITRYSVQKFCEVAAVHHPDVHPAEKLEFAALLSDFGEERHGLQVAG